ncbi:MAG: ATPase [Ruminococcus sp.]|nr:ATPase [Ruminococcus sp.]
MSVSSMHAVNVIGLLDHIDEVIAVLGESGVFHPDEVSNFYQDLQGFTRLQTNTAYAEILSDLKEALRLVQRDISSFESDLSAFSFEEAQTKAADITSQLDTLISEREEALRQLTEAKNTVIAAQHFVGLDEEIQKVNNLNYMNVRFGKLPKESVQKYERYKKRDDVDFVVCTEGKNHCWGAYFVSKDKTAEVDKFFESLYFERVNLAEDGKSPLQLVDAYERMIPELEEQARETQKRLDAFLDENEEQIALCVAKLEELCSFSVIRAKALQHRNSFIIVGWIPSESVKPIKAKLSEIKSVELDFSGAKNELDKKPPAKLKNCFLAKPFEYFTEMYGMPSYNEIDPSLFIAITYIVIFGIMFADLGQGLCLSVVGLIMWKWRKMPIGKILFPCGISSAIFGLVFGSVFGFEHILDPVYGILGFEEKPIEVMAPENTNTVIFGAIGIGVFLLIIAMFLNVYTSLRQKNYGRALFSTSGVAGIIFYCSLVFGLVSEIFLNNHMMTLPYILLLVVLPFILIFFCEPLSKLVNKEKNWQPESWGGYVVENIFESIEILLSYITNTMSFLRVGAFVLVHAGMMMVVFVLAETAGGAGYWITVVIGNIVVMALEALLVAIQVLRLEFYEMFSRFYAGEGRAYQPVKLKAD